MNESSDNAPDLRGVLLADFNTGNLAAVLRNSAGAPAIDPVEAPFGHVEQVLLDPEHPAWTPRPDFALVWTRPMRVLPTFAKASAFEKTDPTRLAAEVDAFARHLAGVRDRVDTVIVPTWLAPREARGLGPLELTHPLGLRRLVLEANSLLLKALEGLSGLFVLDAEDWMRLPDGEATSERLFYLAKIPFTNGVFRNAARDVKAVLGSLTGGARKLVVLDLDNTLWGGVVGEEGWEQLKLGGHDPTGEAFCDFQSALKGLTNRGIVLAVASKNDEHIALEAVDRHPEMVLARDDFSAWRINWSDKARNIAEIAAELDLGLESVVFIDDSPAERARVREALPAVFVPEWPSSPASYARELRALRCFDTPALTDEDRERGTHYSVRAAGRRARAEVSSVDEWRRTLETKVSVETLSRDNLARAAQLLNKTNQMNLATRRLSETELSRWAEQPDHEFWTFRVSDRFGSHGITGLLGLELRGSSMEVVDFLMSCRVLGRNVERSILSWAMTRAAAHDCDRLRAELLPTERNRPCLEFLAESGLEVEANQIFFRRVADGYAPPEGVTLLETASPT